jgi:hypothetical protein
MKVSSFTSITDDGCTWSLFVDENRWTGIPPHLEHGEWVPAVLKFEDEDKRTLIPMRIDLKELGYALVLGHPSPSVKGEITGTISAELFPESF